MKSVLLATANIDHLISLAGILQESGYLVIPAGSADLARSFLQQGIQVDAVIADNGMKGFWGVMGTVRLQSPVPPPIIVISEQVAVTGYLEALSTGAFDFVFLPVRARELIRIVNAAVGEHATQSGAGGDRNQSVTRGTMPGAVDYFV
jgi:DNA-binding NtrC family response regulator